MSLDLPARFLALAWLLTSVSSAAPCGAVALQDEHLNAEALGAARNLVSQEVHAICVVVASDGEHALVSNYAKEIKRASLPGGEVVAQSSTVMLNEPCLLFKLGERVLALGKKRMAVIDDETLEVVASRELETSVYYPRATSPVGDAFVSGKGDVWEIHRLSAEGEVSSLGVQPLPWAKDLAAAAFSADGRKLALATANEVWVMDSRTLEITGNEGMPTVRSTPSTIRTVAFFGNDRLVVGWGHGLDEQAPGVLIHDLRGDAPPQRLQSTSTRNIGGDVRSIYCDPEQKLLVIGMTPAGLLSGFRLEEEKWVEAYNVDYGQGTWGTLKVRGIPGLGEGFVSGMSPEHSSVIDLSTGEILLRRQAKGMAQLQPASEGRLLVGIRSGRLIVLARDSSR